jgi:hypothetical protein
MKSEIVFAATTASPRTNVSAVGPTRCSSSAAAASVPSVARFASRFLTTLNEASLSRS